MAGGFIREGHKFPRCFFPFWISKNFFPFLHRKMCAVANIT